MKEVIAALVLAAAALSLTACGSDSNKNSTAIEKTTSAVREAAADDKIDVDLTAMSSTMIYSKVFNMVTTPSDYKGQMVRMRWNFSTVEDEGERYYACIIADATACCSQGIEFELSDKSLKYPKDYPKADEEITVKGEFDYYKRDVYTYCVLRNAELEAISK